jgi:hypothetical protein
MKLMTIRKANRKQGPNKEAPRVKLHERSPADELECVVGPPLTVSENVRECQAYSTGTRDESFLCHRVSGSVTALLSKLLSKPMR